MDLIHNILFRITGQTTLHGKGYEPGIYRAILPVQGINKTITVCIQADDPDLSRARGGRKMKATTACKRKKPPSPLIGQLLWHDNEVLNELENDRQLVAPIELKYPYRTPSTSRLAQEIFNYRLSVASGFLDQKQLEEGILTHQGIGGLVKATIERTGCSRGLAYKVWSILCRYGFNEKYLHPRFDQCGAPKSARPSDPGGRKKAGRKTTKQRIAKAYGVDLDPTQPGVSTEWAAAIRAADNQIPSPKPSWLTRCTLIVDSAFCSQAEERDGKIVLTKPDLGKYPNDQQIKRVLTVGKTRLERILEQTVKAHLRSALRGLTARNWQGVSGPGHTWAIDSTVGDIYLRSSVDRSWIVGRPIVYIIVDIWSTAIVGFYVCLTGPSWSTAKISLFNSVADPALLGEFWGYHPISTLIPHPNLCYCLLCDRGEYLSKGHRSTATKLLPMTSYTPPYRGDLKGLVEVLHRIEKDAQFLFIPGAIDYRRKELELRKVNPEDCVLTVRDYVQYLYELFCEYNLTADRRHRMTAEMTAAGIHPSPSGLWSFGHTVGVGYRRFESNEDLITDLLPQGEASVRGNGIHCDGNQYWSDKVAEAEWTTIARNYGGWRIPVHQYPGAMSRIWAPNFQEAGLIELFLTDESRANGQMTREEWADVVALGLISKPESDHVNKMQKLEFLRRQRGIIARATELTHEALARASGTSPTWTEARLIEVAAGELGSQSEAQAKEQIRDEAMANHLAMMKTLFEADEGECEASHG